LLAEAHTINDENKEALQVYKEVLVARGDGATAADDSSNKDIYRKMAPLMQKIG